MGIHIQPSEVAATSLSVRLCLGTDSNKEEKSHHSSVWDLLCLFCFFIKHVKDWGMKPSPCMYR